jgi:hypothetical protein
MNDLPQFLRDELSCPPKHKEGVHQWIYSKSRQLWAHRGFDDQVKLFQSILADCGRPVPLREIVEAVRNAEKTQWRPGHNNGPAIWSPEREPWPKCDQRFRADVIELTGYGLCDLIENSPIRLDQGEDVAKIVMHGLFEPGELVCVGHAMNQAETCLLSDLSAERLAGYQFVVPNPMSKPVGINLEGKKSVRCLDNTGERRHAVAEFDSGTLDEQAALLLFLSTIMPLVLVVFSGSKSLHGWFLALPGWKDFFRTACKLGADPAMATKCQFARMPGGRREGGARQSVYWFNPPVSTNK